MSRKTVYYHDPLHDDFAPTNGRIRPKQIGADFPYEHGAALSDAKTYGAGRRSRPAPWRLSKSNTF